MTHLAHTYLNPAWHWCQRLATAWHSAPHFLVYIGIAIVVLAAFRFTLSVSENRGTRKVTKTWTIGGMPYIYAGVALIITFLSASLLKYLFAVLLGGLVLLLTYVIVRSIIYGILMLVGRKPTVGPLLRLWLR